MKTGTLLVAALFALTSFPLLGQQSTPDNTPSTPATGQSSPSYPQSQPTSPAAQPPSSSPSTPSDTQSASPATSPEAAATPATQAIELRPVHAELVSKLDTKTAKAGDELVAQTKSSVKTADGTEIPKGTKLVGHVAAVQPSTGGQNSQVALLFDHAELKGGQNLPIHSEIQSIAPAGGSDSSSSMPAAGAGGMSGASRGGSASAGGSDSGSGSGSSGSTGSSSGSAGSSGAATAPGYTPGYSPSPGGTSSAAASGGPAAGTIVARNGKIAIRSTSVPGVLLANNAPGEQDPRMTQASGILLGAKQDVQLEGGTQMVIGVAASSGGTSSAPTK